MYGKHFESMYEGSMVGKGATVFAVWGYVIAKARSSRVELNPVLLSAILGCGVEEVAKAIGVLEEPDEYSRNREHGGRKLVKEGQFQYFIPSWEYYHGMRNEEDRREYNRERQKRYRRRKSGMLAQQMKKGEAAGCDVFEYPKPMEGERASS